MALSFLMLAQNKLGEDKLLLLNKKESEYFNKEIKREFDFNDKRVLFLYDYYLAIINKKDYFELWGVEYLNKGINVGNQLIVIPENDIVNIMWMQ